MQKRFISVMSIIAMASVLLLLFTGCSPTADSVFDIKPLSSKKIREITEKYYQEFRNHEYSAENTVYYGTYDGCVVYRYKFWHGHYYKTEIAGETLEYDAIMAYKDGEFYGYEEAYEQGILTAKHIAQIAKYHKEYEEYWLNREVIDTDVESVFDIEPLPGEKQLELIVLWQENGCDCEFQWDQYSESDERIAESLYLGTYDSCDVLFVRTAFEGLIRVPAVNTGFHLPKGCYWGNFIVHRNGRFYCLYHAYKKGFITKANADTVLNYYNEYKNSEE